MSLIAELNTSSTSTSDLKYMKNFEYVMSGLSLTRTINNLDIESFFPLYKEFCKSITDTSIKNISLHNKSTTAVISCLYNAFTEPKFGEKLKNRDRLNCTSVYADSGGLQMVTAGKTITPDLKKKVYQAQTNADYGFCFDTIPLERVTKGPITQAERTNPSNKLFIVDKFPASALQTGKDICEQLQYFDSSNANTQGFIIVQGNNWKDMVQWFNIIIDQIPDSLKYKIRGIALADTCMGNDTLETIEMLRAAKEINNLHGDQYTKHIHLLGVGSITRMKPCTLLMRSGYLDFIQQVSYDSTKHTQGMTKGIFYDEQKYKDTPPYKHFRSLDAFKKIFTRYENIFGQYFTQDEFIDSVFSVEKWSTTTVATNNPNQSEPQNVVMKTIPYAWTVYQVEEFMKDLDNEYSRKVTRGNVIDDLFFVKTQEDMDRWFANSSYKCNSARITRSDAVTSLLDFLE